MFKPWKILLVEDDEDDYFLTRSMLSEIKGAHHKLVWASSYDQALDKLAHESWDVLLVDYDLGLQTGLDLVRMVNEISARTPVILLTGRGSYETDVEAMYAGASDYLTKVEVSGPLLERAIRYAIERKQIETELLAAKNELEARVRERTQALEKAYKELVEAEKHMAMSRMIASVAHELNNPIQTIENCLYLVKSELSSNSSSSEILNMALSEARRIATLVSQLREIYRPSKVGPMQPVNLNDLVVEVHVLISPHLQHHKVTWNLEVPPGKFMVTAIADQIKQVFLNISLNAIEAMQPEGGSLCVSISEISESDQIAIAFRDTGPGISQDHVERLFEPFFTTKDKGTGLGLAICYDIIQRHGGQILCKSELGRGAEFTVVLPCSAG